VPIQHQNTLCWMELFEVYRRKQLFGFLSVLFQAGFKLVVLQTIWRSIAYDAIRPRNIPAIISPVTIYNIRARDVRYSTMSTMQRKKYIYNRTYRRKTTFLREGLRFLRATVGNESSCVDLAGLFDQSDYILRYKK
jgi:hypothetical protein